MSEFLGKILRFFFVQLSNPTTALSSNREFISLATIFFIGKKKTITKNRQVKHLESILNCAFNSPHLSVKFFRREISFSRFNIYFVPFRGLFSVCFRDSLTNMIYLDV